jgi:hypothetical protein
MALVDEADVGGQLGPAAVQHGRRLPGDRSASQAALAGAVARRAASAVGCRARSRPRWQVRLMQLQAGWKLLWAERLRRDLDPIYRLVACRRGRHRDAHVLADDLIGSQLGDDYPEVAVCEVCGRP